MNKTKTKTKKQKWIKREMLKDGDKFTIQGVRTYPDGRITMRCRPGNETVYVARELK
jgi:hypothetical protein